jgi:hypothetical protein
VNQVGESKWTETGLDYLGLPHESDHTMRCCSVGSSLFRGVGLEVSGFGFQGSRVSGFEFRVSGIRYRVSCFGFRGFRGSFFCWDSGFGGRGQGLV